jgi:predicted small metal-binding protein
MMASYQFKCKNIGMDCDFETKAKSIDEIMPKIKEHAESAHKITTIDDELKNKITASIKKKTLF